jgi:hypothetical protein
LEDKSLLQKIVVDHLILINRSVEEGLLASSRLWLGVNHVHDVYAMGYHSFKPATLHQTQTQGMSVSSM